MGKYTVYDLRDGKTLAFENRRQLTQWWLRANPVGVIHWHQSMNREELFTKRKSMETTHGILGFRTGNPKLKARKGMTWAGILELLKIKGKNYVRMVEEVAKDKLLAERDLDECKVVMEACCIDVVQDETFFVEPKSEG